MQTPQPPHDLEAAHQDMAALLGFIHTRLDKGKLFQADLERGVNHVTVWKVLGGKSVRPETVRRIARNAKAPIDLRDRAVRGAELLHFHALSQARRARPPRAPAPLPAPPQPVPQDVRKRCTPRGLWFVELVYERFGSPEAFCRAAVWAHAGKTRHMKPKTLEAYFYDGTFYPRATTVEVIARTLSQPGYTPVTTENVLLRFGGRTFEDFQRQGAQAVTASRPKCPVCDRPVLRQPSRRPSQHSTCSYGCEAVYRITRSGIETELGRWLVAVMAAAVDVPADQIARLLSVSSEMVVPTWIDKWRPRVEAIRQAMQASPKRSHSLVQATAAVLGISRHPGLGAFLHHRIRHPDRQHRGRRRTVAPEYLRGKTLAALVAFFNCPEREILAAANRRGTMAQFCREHGPQASVQRFRLTDQGRPFSPGTHAVAQATIEAAWRGGDGSAVIPDSPLWDALRHARSCTVCRRRAAAYLHVRQRRTFDQVGNFFRCTPRHAARLIAEGKRVLGA